jgi:hypothetical protein
MTLRLLRLAIAVSTVACAKPQPLREHDPREHGAAAAATPSSAPGPGEQATPEQGSGSGSGASSPAAAGSPLDAGSPPDAGASVIGSVRPRRAPIDPKKIVGYVSGRRGHFASRGSGRIDKLAVAPIDLPGAGKDLATLTFSIVDAGKVHTFSLTVPRKLPLPFADGDEVTFQAGTDGGGPNQRDHVVITAPDGSLLFAVGREPSGWTVERGARVGKGEPASGYVTYSHEVSFRRDQTTTVVKPGAWAVLDSFYVWGAAASRVLDRGKPPPPDYVGSWLDFAIITQ